MDTSIDTAMVIELINENPPMSRLSHTCADYGRILLPYLPDGTRLENLMAHLSKIAKEHSDKLTSVTVEKVGNVWRWKNPVAPNAFTDAERAEIEAFIHAKTEWLRNLIKELTKNTMDKEAIMRILLEEIPKHMKVVVE